MFCSQKLRRQKLCTHVIVDPKDTRALSGETPHGFRANQSRRTCNNDRAHHVTRSDGFLAVVFRDEAILEFRRASRDTCVTEYMTAEKSSFLACATIRRLSMSPRLRRDSLALREIASPPRAHARSARDFSMHRRKQNLPRTIDERKCERQAPRINLGTKFATTLRVISSNAAVPGKSDAVWPSSPRPRRIKSC